MASTKTPRAKKAAEKPSETQAKPVTSVNPPSNGSSNHGADGDMEAAIRARAYELWEKRGRPEGASHEDWLQAEREIRSGRGQRSA